MAELRAEQLPPVSRTTVVARAPVPPVVRPHTPGRRDWFPDAGHACRCHTRKEPR
jgi:hypothetical protein